MWCWLGFHSWLYMSSAYRRVRVCRDCGKFQRLMSKSVWRDVK